MRILAGLMLAALLVAACGTDEATWTPNGGGAGSPSAAATYNGPTPRGTATESCSAPGTGTPGYFAIGCSVQSPSLALSKLGDDPFLSVVVLLPDDYDSTTAALPTVYVLSDFGADESNLQDALSGALPSVSAWKSDAIVVLVSGTNALGGSFYVNSALGGNWEDAIVKDLVPFMDSHYRTRKAADSRGIAGHGMGGYGALRLAMLHPDVFGAVYAMSPDVFDATGAAEALADPTVVAGVLELRDTMPADPAGALAELPISAAAADPAVQFDVAYGIAFAPDPTSRLLSQFPWTTAAGARDEQVWGLWQAGLGDWPAKVREHEAGLRQLKAIAIDYGTADENVWLPKGSAALVGLLQQAGLPVTAATFDGGHDEKLGDRMANFMLPFMAQKLAH